MSISDEAKRIVHGDRGGNYGHPWDDFSRSAAMWTPILGVEVTPEQVAMCLVAVKLSRLVETPGHHDSVVDVAGYAECLGMVQERRKEQG